MARPSFSSTTNVRHDAHVGIRPVRSAAVALLVLLGVTAGGAFPFGTRAAAVTAPSTLVLLRESQWVKTTAGMHLEVGVRSDLAPSRLGLVVTLYSQVTERGYFEETLTGDMQDFSVLTSSPIIPLANKGLLGPGGVASLDLPIAPPAVPGPASKPPRNGTILNVPCSGSCEGVYPLQVSLEDRQTYTPLDSFMTYLVLVPRRVTSPLRFSLVVPVGSRRAISSAGRPLVSQADEAELELMAGDFSAHPSVPVTVALYPQLATALELKAAERVKPAHGPPRPAPGAAGAAKALSALRRLVRLPNVELSGETYTRSDLSALAVSHLAVEARFQFAAGRAALLSLGARLAGAPYASTMPIGPRGLALVKAAGMRRLIVPSDAVSPPPPSWVYPVWAPFLVPGVKGEEADASDFYLEQHLESSADPVLRADQLLADLAVLYYVEQPPGSRGVSLLAPHGWHPSAAFLSTVLAGLATTPVVRPVSLRALFRQVPAASGEIPPPGEAVSPLLYRSVFDSHIPRSDLLPRGPLATARSRLAALGMILGRNPAALDAVKHTVLVGETAGLTRGVRAAYLTAPNRVLRQEERLLSLPRKRTITITSLSARIPVSVSSKAPIPLDVDLRLSGCRFSDADCHGGISFRRRVFALTSSSGLGPLRPGNRTIEVHVSARSSGDFYLYMELTSPRGGVVLAYSHIVIRSTAISGVAVVLTGVAGAFLIAWWMRSAFRRRRGRHARRVGTAMGHVESASAR